MVTILGGVQAANFSVTGLYFVLPRWGGGGEGGDGGKECHATPSFDDQIRGRTEHLPLLDLHGDHPRLGAVGQLQCHRSVHIVLPRGGGRVRGKG